MRSVARANKADAIRRYLRHISLFINCCFLLLVVQTESRKGSRQAGYDLIASDPAMLFT